MRSCLLSWEWRGWIQAGAYIDPAGVQPRGNGGIVVHRCESAKLANHRPATRTVGRHGWLVDYSTFTRD
jgi:hypothetical protein